MFKKLLAVYIILSSLITAFRSGGSSSQSNVPIQTQSRSLLGSKTQPWQSFMEGASGCVSVAQDGLICGFTAVSAGFQCAWSYIRCVVPRCDKCCGKGIFRWACSPCRCDWNCSQRTCNEVFNQVANTCKITADDCVSAFNALGQATKDFFNDVGNKIKNIANKIAQTAAQVAEQAWNAVKYVWDQIKSFLDMIKFFEVANAIAAAFQCFGKIGSAQTASNNAGTVKTVAETSGKSSVLTRIDTLIPGFKAFICCLQSTAIGRVLNKWGNSLLNWSSGWNGLKVGNFLDDPAIVISLAASLASGYSVGTSLDIAFSTAFNIGLYWTVCAGFVTDIGAGVSIVVNLFRKWTFIPGQAVAVSFSVGIPSTPIGAGLGVVLPIGASSIDFGAVNLEVGVSNGVSPVSVGGHVCDTIELVSFNLLELIGNILTAGNECPSSISALESNSVTTEEEQQNRRRVLSTNEMRNKILLSHKKKVISNHEIQIRQQIEKNRRLQEEEVTGAGIENNEELPLPPPGTPIQGTPIPIDTDVCGANNIAADERLMVDYGFDKMDKKLLAKKYCRKPCQKNLPGGKGRTKCMYLRDAICKKGWLGSDLNTLKKCCDKLQNDPQDLWYRIRKFCAQNGKVKAPKKKKWCQVAKKSTADDFMKKSNLINMIMDGCVAKFDDEGCKNIKGKTDANKFANAVRKLCKKKKKTTQILNTSQVVGGFGVAVLLIAIGIKKFRKNDDDASVSYHELL